MNTSAFIRSDKAARSSGSFQIFALAAGLFASALIGALLALGAYIPAIGLLILIAGIGLIVFPQFGLWVAIIGSLVASGLVDLYMPSLRLLIWGVALLAMAIAAIALVKSSFAANSQLTVACAERTAIIVSASTFILFAIITSLINWSGFSAFLVGLKGYFQVWGLLIAIYYFLKNEKSADRLITFLLWLGVFQLPFIAHQFLVLAPARISEVFAQHNIVANDIVAGTFGGSEFGGGRSSSLALLDVICITIMLAKWRAKQSSTALTIFAILIFLIPMFLSEAKIFLVLLPLAIYMLFNDRILRSPVKALVGAVALILLLGAIFFAYSLLPGAKSQQSKSIEDMWNSNIEYNFGSRGYGSALLNRSSVYGFWVKEHARMDNLVPTLIGHGLGETSNGTTVNDNTLASTRYRGYGIDLTGLSGLLWEVGLLGTFALIAMFTYAYKLGGRQLVRWKSTSYQSSIRAAQISVVLFAVSLLHNSYFLFDISFQSLFMVIIGYILVMSRFETPYA